MKNSKEVYESLINLLHKSGINDPQDIHQIDFFPPPSSDRDPNRDLKLQPKCVLSNLYPWVEDFYLIIKRNYNSIIEEWKSQGNVRTVVPTLEDKFLFPAPARHLEKNERDLTPKNVEAVKSLSQYGSIFPNRTLLLSNDFVVGFAGKFWITADFLTALIVLKPFLKEGLVTLLPAQIRSEREKVKKVLPESTAYIKLSKVGKGIKAFEETVGEPNTEHSFNPIIRVPSLQGARPQDYLELVKTYPEEFSVYNSLLDKSFTNSEPSKSQVKSWLEEADYRIKKLEQRYQSKKKKLKSRGKRIAIETLFTIGSILTPWEIITDVLGGTTILDGIDWWNEYRNLGQQMSDDDFWLLWKLNQSGEDEE